MKLLSILRIEHGLREYIHSPLGWLLQCERLTHFLRRPLDASNLGTNLRDRRLKALEGFIAPLDLDVPPPAEQTNVLDKISAKQVSRKISKDEKKELEKQGKQIKEQRKKSNNRSDDSDASSVISLECELQSLERKIDRINEKAEERKRNAKDSRKFDKIEEKRVEEVEKVEKEIRKNERDLKKKTDKASKKAEKRESKACGSSKEDDKDRKKAGKLEWIVIESV